MSESKSSPRADKRLGQHFLHDKNILGRIASATGANENTTVLEIGPGPGALTSTLLTTGARVVAVEKDQRFVPLLEELSKANENRLTIHLADALKVNISTLVPKTSIMAGNLPYNVGTEIVLNTIKQHRSHFAKMVFLLQKEVVLRICAQPNTSDWGRLGVWCDLYCERAKLFDVAAGAFSPPPKVTSSVVLLTPLPAPRFEVEEKKLDRLLRTVFLNRRKMLRKSLKGQITAEQMEAVGIKPTLRPENLSTEQLCLLANII
jgi:16S rRNA (adenine1518-N6/adenine1519-N6)-dimethyltransferase